VAAIPVERDREWSGRLNGTVATVDEAAGYSVLVGFPPEMYRTPAVSWIGQVMLDTEGVEAFFASLTS